MTLPLASVGKVCKERNLVGVFDDEKSRLFDKKTLKLVATGNIQQNNLYMMDVTADVSRVRRVTAVPRVEQPTACNAYEIKIMLQLIQYLHAAAGYIPKSTWIKCINAGFYATWPGLTATKVRKYLPDKVEEVTLGHLNLKKQGIRSTSKPRSK